MSTDPGVADSAHEADEADHIVVQPPSRSAIRPDVRARVEAFVEFAVAHLRREPGGTQATLVRLYNTAHPEMEPSQATAFFKQHLVSMSSLQKAAAPDGNVDLALAEIGQTRVNFSNLSIEETKRQLPRYRAAIDFCVNYCRRNPETILDKKTLEDAWTSAPENTTATKLSTLFANGALTMLKLPTTCKKRKADDKVKPLGYEDVPKGGIQFPMASFGVGGEFGTGGKYDSEAMPPRPERALV